MLFWFWFPIWAPKVDQFPFNPQEKGEADTPHKNQISRLRPRLFSQSLNSETKIETVFSSLENETETETAIGLKISDQVFFKILVYLCEPLFRLLPIFHHKSLKYFLACIQQPFVNGKTLESRNLPLLKTFNILKCIHCFWCWCSPPPPPFDICLLWELEFNRLIFKA